MKSQQTIERRHDLLLNLEICTVIGGLFLTNFSVASEHQFTWITSFLFDQHLGSVFIVSGAERPCYAVYWRYAVAKTITGCLMLGGIILKVLPQLV